MRGVWQATCGQGGVGAETAQRWREMRERKGSQLRGVQPGMQPDAGPPLLNSRRQAGRGQGHCRQGPRWRPTRSASGRSHHQPHQPCTCCIRQRGTTEKARECRPCALLVATQRRAAGRHATGWGETQRGPGLKAESQRFLWCTPSLRVLGGVVVQRHGLEVGSCGSPGGR